MELRRRQLPTGPRLRMRVLELVVTEPRHRPARRGGRLRPRDRRWWRRGRGPRVPDGRRDRTLGRTPWGRDHRQGPWCSPASPGSPGVQGVPHASRREPPAAGLIPLGPPLACNGPWIVPASLLPTSLRLPSRGPHLVKFIWAIIGGLLLAAGLLRFRWRRREPFRGRRMGPSKRGSSDRGGEPRAGGRDHPGARGEGGGRRGSHHREDLCSGRRHASRAGTTPIRRRTTLASHRRCESRLAAGEVELGDEILLPDLEDIPDPVIDAAAVADLDDGRADRDVDEPATAAVIEVRRAPSSRSASIGRSPTRRSNPAAS